MAICLSLLAPKIFAIYEYFSRFNAQIMVKMSIFPQLWIINDIQTCLFQPVQAWCSED